MYLGMLGKRMIRLKAESNIDISKEKKKKFSEAQIQRISKVFAPQTGNEGFYCVFK